MKCRSEEPEASDPSCGGRRPEGPPAITASEHWDRRRWHARPNSRLTSIARTRQVTVTKIICGVDISSRSLQARVGAEGPSGCFSNNAEGIAELAEFCRQHQVELVAMEATGGYERQPLAHLWAQGLPGGFVTPRSVRRFAEAVGVLGKTDRIDAGMIAWFAQVKHVSALAPVSAEQERLKALVIRLRQLTDLRTIQRNQRLLVKDPVVLESFHRILA